MKRLGLGVVALLVLLVLLTALGGPAGVAATTAPECVTANADGSLTVPLDWELKPPDMGAGEQFRLLFITSRQRNAVSTRSRRTALRPRRHRRLAGPVGSA